MNNNFNEFRFEAKDSTIDEELFGQIAQYRIPPFQRPYSWKEDQISDFWDDLNSNVSSYFLGSLVYNHEFKNDKGYIDVIDGQQRLLTITIFMAVLRDIAEKIDKDADLQNLIQRHNIFIESSHDGSVKPRIIPGRSTSKFFKEYIQKDKKNKEEANQILSLKSKKMTQEEKQIQKAYSFFKDKIEKRIDMYSSDGKKLEELTVLRAKIGQAKVIRIQLYNQIDAYEVFETVNARGEDLTVSDLIKNLIFKEIKPRGEKQEEEISQKWSEIEGNVKESGGGLKRFLRYYWLSRYKFLTEKQLFREIKNSSKVSNKSKFLKDLHEASIHYKLITSNDEESWVELHKDGLKLSRSMKGINLLNVSQCYVLFLNIIRNLDKLGSSPKYIFDVVEKFTFIYSSVCKQPGNKVERLYTKFSVELEKVLSRKKPPIDKITKKEVDNILSRLVNELKNIRPSFRTFEEHFENVSYRESTQGRQFITYILDKINSSKTETPEFKIDFENVNIEHLLPKKPNKKAWNLTPSDIKDYVHKIGNLTLLNKRLNSSIQNGGIKEKIPDLEKSEIQITKELTTKLRELEFKWDEEQIKKRQNELAGIAFKKIWKF